MYSVVVKLHVTYTMEHVYHVSMDGQRNSAKQAHIFLHTDYINSSKILFKPQRVLSGDLYRDILQ